MTRSWLTKTEQVLAPQRSEIQCRQHNLPVALDYLFPGSMLAYDVRIAPGASSADIDGIFRSCAMVLVVNPGSQFIMNDVRGVGGVGIK